MELQEQMKPATYAPSSDFFFQAVFVAATMSIVSGAVAERMKLWAFLLFAVVMTGFIYPIEGSWTWGGQAGIWNVYTWAIWDFQILQVRELFIWQEPPLHLAGVLILLGARKGKYDK